MTHKDIREDNNPMLENLLKEAEKDLGLCVDSKHTFGGCDCKNVKKFLKYAITTAEQAGYERGKGENIKINKII